MDFKVEDQRIYALCDEFGPEMAKEKAEELKEKAFGAIDKLFFRAKKEDIEVRYVEMRYEPFWHILYRTHVEYERTKKYSLSVDPQVKSVSISGLPYSPSDCRISLDGVEHCMEDLSREVFIDAVSGKNQGFERHIGHGKRELEQTEELLSDDSIVVPARIKASFLTRNIISEMLKPVEAEEITLEEITVEKLHLYFRPLYAFEYLWVPKNKTSVLEFDAITSEVRSGGTAFRQKMKEVISEADLFELGSDAVDFFVPGGGLALKLAKSVIKKK